MRSKAHIQGHPIHPMLIPFPFTLLFSAAAFDLAGRIAGRPQWWRTGDHMRSVGIWSALVAAIPGAMDYFYRVPPKSSGNRRAILHALSNLSAVVLYAVAGRTRRGARPTIAELCTETTGAALLCIGGYMGGTLVYRNQIGVDRRYAESTKFSEASIDAAGEDWVSVSNEEDLAVNQMKLLHVNGLRLVLARTEKGYAAFDDRCTHRGGSLSDGALVCDTVQCPWHGSQFDAATGAVRRGPATDPISAYTIRLQDGEVKLNVRELREREEQRQLTA